MELSIPYEFRAIDGSRFVVGNSIAAMADPDWIGFLDPDGGVTGLLDGANVRPGAANPLNAADGLSGIGPSWLAGRSGTVQGILSPNVAIAAREALEQKAKKAYYAMLRADGTMKWTPSAGGGERMLRVRAVGDPSFRGRQPCTFMLTFASRDPHIVSSAIQRIELAAGNFTFSGQPFTSASQPGDAPAEPWFRVDGPINLPTRFWDHQGVDYGDGYSAVLTTSGTALTELEFLLLLPHRGLVLRGAKVLYDWEAAGLSGWAGYTGSGESLFRQNSFFHSGSWGLEVDVSTPGVGRGAFIGMPVVKGRTYQVSTWVRGFVGGELLSLVVGNPQTAAAVRTDFAATTAWQRVQATFTALVSGNVAAVVSSRQNTGCTFFLDDCYIDREAVDASGLLVPAGSTDPSSGGLVGPWPLPYGSNIQWDASGTTARTPLAQMMWRNSWR